MELQFLDIDKYISWYKEISKEVEYAKNNEWKVKHYAALSYDLHKRYWNNNKNLKSKELSEKALSIAKETEQRIKPVKEYMLQVPPDNKEVFYIPTLVEWAQFDGVINSFTDAPKQYTESKNKGAALPEIDRLKDELKRVNEDTKPPYLENISQGIAIINGQKNGIFKNWAFDFADFVSNVYYAKWLHEKIQELTPPDVSGSPVLYWNLSQRELSELIKALYLCNAFKVKSESELVRTFETITKTNLRRHTANIDEIQDLQESELLTGKMSKEIESYIKAKITKKPRK